MNKAIFETINQLEDEIGFHKTVRRERELKVKQYEMRINELEGIALKYSRDCEFYKQEANKLDEQVLKQGKTLGKYNAIVRENEDLRKKLRKAKENKKKLLDLNKEIESLQSMLTVRTENSETLEEAQKLNNFLKEKLEITETSLKEEIEKRARLANELEDMKNAQKEMVDSLNIEINEKNGKLIELNKHLSELERKSVDCFEDYYHKEQLFHESLAKTQDSYNEELKKLKKYIEDLKSSIRDKELLIESLKKTSETKSQEFSKAISDKKALERSITDLEISLKSLDIQQTRQNLEELAILRKKFALDSEIKEEAQERISDLRCTCETLQKKIVQDSEIMRNELARKDLDIFKLKNKTDSKIKEKEAEFAMKIEEIKADLTDLLEELLNGKEFTEICSVLEHILQNL